MISTHPLAKSHGPGGGWVGIRAGFVLVVWRPFFWIAAEVVQASTRLVAALDIGNGVDGFPEA